MPTEPNEAKAGVQPFAEQVSAKLSEYMQATPITKRTLAGFTAFLSGK